MTATQLQQRVAQMVAVVAGCSNNVWLVDLLRRLLYAPPEGDHQKKDRKKERKQTQVRERERAREIRVLRILGFEY
jgi:hypothetical protein